MLDCMEKISKSLRVWRYEQIITSSTGLRSDSQCSGRSVRNAHIHSLSALSAIPTSLARILIPHWNGTVKKRMMLFNRMSFEQCIAVAMAGREVKI